MEKIIKNAAECKGCGDYIESKHRHDFVTCKCAAISIDGGKEYFRRIGKPEMFIDKSIVEE